MPEMDGFEFIKHVREVPVLIITGHGDKESAIRAVDSGAFGFFEKPFDLDSLEVNIKRAHEKFHLLRERADLLRKLDRLCQFQNREIENFNRNRDSQFVGTSPQIEEVRFVFNQLAKKPLATVLIGGETGTGKEVAARELHMFTHGSLSSQSAPFVALNCSAIPPDLLESELYGHEKGSFSGATSSRIGLAEAAREGTLFLDEIGDMDLRHQAKLLRLVQERRFRRVGSNSEIDFKGRIVAATHRDLKALSKQNLFREDLYFRLSVVSVEMAPLRKRGSDIMLLAVGLCERHGLKGVAPERVAELLCYSWPGNIRELNNWIERATILGKYDESLLVTDPVPTGTGAEKDVAGSEVLATLQVQDIKAERGRILDDFDRMVIERALFDASGNLSRAAQAIGLDRKNFARRMKELSVEPWAPARPKKKAA
jgi:DNA-binding NtrC family response regulator